MKIGRRKEVPLREIWPNEARDFTPWLADNLPVLGEDLDLDLEIVEKEHSVGSFSLDLLAREVGNERPVAIENQLEGTDHTHLGQLITYASGVGKSGIGIWISKQFSEPHRKALEWLNDSSEWDFFGVEVRAFSIDDSPPAPFFDVVVKPNQWSRIQKIKEKTSLSPTNELYRQFWSGLLAAFKEKYPGITNATGEYAQSWCPIPAGRSGVYFSWAFRMGNRFHIELYIDFGEKEKNEDLFDELYRMKAGIESEYGGGISWEKIEDKRACRIASYFENASIKNVPGNLQDWAVENMKRFRDALVPHLQRLIS